MEKENSMQITMDTRISDILLKYGDIAEVMEVFGVKRVGKYSLRMFLAKALNVEWAARIHKVPLDEFLEILHKAVAKKETEVPNE
jgi:acyl carrier protein phosphodiesterase